MLFLSVNSTYLILHWQFYFSLPFFYSVIFLYIFVPLRVSLFGSCAFRLRPATFLYFILFYLSNLLFNGYAMKMMVRLKQAMELIYMYEKKNGMSEKKCIAKKMTLHTMAYAHIESTNVRGIEWRKVNTMKDQSYLKAFTSKNSRREKECKRLASEMRCNEVFFTVLFISLLFIFINDFQWGFNVNNMILFYTVCIALERSIA